jgi:7-cyano-7-deazaguanine synthase in queuosine biosynthesis
MKTENFIPEGSKKIGLMVSGGLDSALMLYLLTKEIKDKNLTVDFETYTIRQDVKASLVHSKRIISTIEKLNDIEIKNSSFWNPEAHSDYEIVFGVIGALNKEHSTGLPLSVLFMATTSVPEELANVPGAPYRNRKPTFAVEQPWGDVSKDNVVKYIKENNLQILIENSLSCTNSKSIHCGECWNCKERKWALDLNNQTELYKEIL